MGPTNTVKVKLLGSFSAVLSSELPIKLADYEDMVFRMKMPDDLKRG